MPTSVILAFAGAAVLAVGLVLWIRSRRPAPKYGEFNVPGVGKIRWPLQSSARFDGVICATRISNIKKLVWPKYESIYGKKVPCVHGTIGLDPDYYKVAQMNDVDRTRNITLNPLLNYERGYAAELHNLIRYELFGFNHVYNTVSKADQKKYDRATRIIKAI